MYFDLYEIDMPKKPHKKLQCVKSIFRFHQLIKNAQTSQRFNYELEDKMEVN